MEQLGLWVLALALGYTGAASIPQCCKEKSVGGVSYTLLEETDTARYGCKSNCVFEREGSPGSRFCFKEGDLEVVCEDDDGAGGSEPPPIQGGPTPGIEEPPPEVGRSVCSYSSDHTLNLYPEPAATCGSELIYAGLEPWAKELLLDKHNEMRQRVAAGTEPGQPTASNMMKLVWNEELETSAQRWADQCQGDMKDEVRDKCDGTPVGQNVFMASSDTEEDMEVVVEAMTGAVDAWYNQVTEPGFMPEDISPYMFMEGTEEYTQLVWAETTEVGCGMVYYQDEAGSYQHVVVCNYATAGNYGGDLYRPGQSCANCPLGTQCDDNYQALCAQL